MRDEKVDSLLILQLTEKTYLYDSTLYDISGNS